MAWEPRDFPLLRRELQLNGFVVFPDLPPVGMILSPHGAWSRGWTKVECACPGCESMSWHSDQTLEDTPDPGSPHMPRAMLDQTDERVTTPGAGR